MRKRPALVLLFSVAVYFSAAQQVLFKTYTVQDGLVANPVRCIYQDSKGFIWLGTFEGLSRYDGYKFINFTTHNGQTQMVPITDDMGRVTILDGFAPLTKALPKNNVNASEGTLDGFDVTVRPNPTNSGFTLRIESNSMEPAEVRVFDIQGKLVKKLKATSHNLRLGNELRSGVYIIEVQQQGYTKTIKLIKF